jgi:hypothetical protein
MSDATNSEPPLSFRRHFVRVNAVMLGVVALVLLGSGPVCYLSVRREPRLPQPPGGQGLVNAFHRGFYVPLDAVISKTPLKQPYHAYNSWWYLKAVGPFIYYYY